MTKTSQSVQAAQDKLTTLLKEDAALHVLIAAAASALTGEVVSASLVAALGVDDERKAAS